MAQKPTVSRTNQVSLYLSILSSSLSTLIITGYQYLQRALSLCKAHFLSYTYIILPLHLTLVSELGVPWFRNSREHKPVLLEEWQVTQERRACPVSSFQPSSHRERSYTRDRTSQGEVRKNNLGVSAKPPRSALTEEAWN